MSVKIPWRRNKKSSGQRPAASGQEEPTGSLRPAASGQEGTAGKPPELQAAPPVPEVERPEVNRAEIEELVIEALRTVYDPEIPVNIYELGLVYAVDVSRTGEVVVRMTLTSPGCPVAVSLPIEVESKVQMTPGVTSAKVELVWDPPWGPEKMTDAARLQLGFF
jgi:FeS assembly SUF system protein